MPIEKIKDELDLGTLCPFTAQVIQRMQPIMETVLLEVMAEITREEDDPELETDTNQSHLQDHVISAMMICSSAAALAKIRGGMQHGHPIDHLITHIQETLHFLDIEFSKLDWDMNQLYKHNGTTQ